MNKITKILSVIIPAAAIILGIVKTNDAKAECLTANCTPQQTQTIPGSSVNTSRNDSQSAASNSGVQQHLTIKSGSSSKDAAYSGGYRVESVPSVSAPALTTTLTETCMGSTTGGLAVMGFGISGGTTWKDEECIRRLNARELANTLGERDASKELLCGNQEINEVYKALGRPCIMGPSTTTFTPGGALRNVRMAPDTIPVQSRQVEIVREEVKQVEVDTGG